MVIQRDYPPARRFQNEMIVLFDFRRVNTPTTRHPQMKYQHVLPVGIDQAIFGAAPQRLYPCARQPLAQIGWDWPTQVCTARFRTNNQFAFKDRPQAGDSRFHFR